eukprot:GEZU01019658.1.p2 GENE.GEZU01019658.1~~GEZU01019658.1.p2  ORF type:complete len:153 (-),score=45.06 GEZU01019658.1:636-1094(-)
MAYCDMTNGGWQLIAKNGKMGATKFLKFYNHDVNTDSLLDLSPSTAPSEGDSNHFALGRFSSYADRWVLKGSLEATLTSAASVTVTASAVPNSGCTIDNLLVNSGNKCSVLMVKDSSHPFWEQGGVLTPAANVTSAITSNQPAPQLLWLAAL